MNLTSSIMQGASKNSRMSYVTGNVGPLSSSVDMVLQNANMEGASDGHVNTMLSPGINPTSHDLFGASDNNLARPAPMNDLPREPKFTYPVCINELIGASSTICGHIFCKKCI
uniref:Uncharacterized protein n=1 Tax=Triticum urartu TaxID=4572 RepID=A0A8R7PYY8_TRIUA